MWRKIRKRADRFDIRSNSLEENWRQDTRRYLAADSAARRLQFSCTEVGTTQSSVQRKQQDPTKDLADEIRALLKQRHRSDSPRQIEGTWQYNRRHLAVKHRKWLPQTDRRYSDSTLEALGSRKCSPATAALLLRCRINRAQSKTSRTLRRIWQTKSGPTGTKCRCNSPRQIEGTLTVH